MWLVARTAIETIAANLLHTVDDPHPPKFAISGKYVRA